MNDNGGIWAFDRQSSYQLQKLRLCKYCDCGLDCGTIFDKLISHP